MKSKLEGCANMINDCLVEAGFPKNTFNNLQIPNSFNFNCDK